MSNITYINEKAREHHEGTKKQYHCVDRQQFRLWITDSNPHGVHAVVITDEDYEVVGWVDEAVYGMGFDPSAGPGAVSCVFHGESVGCFEENDGYASIEAILAGELTDLEAVQEICWEDFLKNRAVSPVDPLGFSVLREVISIMRENTYFIVKPPSSPHITLLCSN